MPLTLLSSRGNTLIGVLVATGISAIIMAGISYSISSMNKSAAGITQKIEMDSILNEARLLLSGSNECKANFLGKSLPEVAPDAHLTIDSLVSPNIAVNATATQPLFVTGESKNLVKIVSLAVSNIRDTSNSSSMATLAITMSGPSYLGASNIKREVPIRFARVAGTRTITSCSSVYDQASIDQSSTNAGSVPSGDGRCPAYTGPAHIFCDGALHQSFNNNYNVRFFATSISLPDGFPTQQVGQQMTGGPSGSELVGFGCWNGTWTSANRCVDGDSPTGLGNATGSSSSAAASADGGGE